MRFNKRRAIVACLLLFASLTSACLSDEHQYEERKFRRTEWEDSAELVMVRVEKQVPELGERLAILNDRSVLAAPMPAEEGHEPYKLLEPEKPNMIVFVPLLEGDEKIDPLWESLVSDPDAGGGLSLIRAGRPPVLVAQNKEYTEFWQTLLGMHEIGHIIDKRPNDPYWLQELRVKLVDLKLIRARGGERYNELVLKHLEKVKGELSSAGGVNVVYHTTYYIDELDVRDIFGGPARSEDEKRLRMTYFDLDIQFRFLESKYGSSKNEEFFKNWIEIVHANNQKVAKERKQQEGKEK